MHWFSRGWDFILLLSVLVHLLFPLDAMEIECGSCSLPFPDGRSGYVTLILRRWSLRCQH